MKKFKLNAVITIALYVMLTVMISSCEESKLPETPSKFVVIRIELNKTKGTSIYLVNPVEKRNLNINSTCFVDSAGRFNVGDTLSFQHYH